VGYFYSCQTAQWLTWLTGGPDSIPGQSVQDQTWNNWDLEFLVVFRLKTATVIPPMFHTHSFIYHLHCIIFVSQCFSFPCQYHSTNDPYSFIHLPPTLYNIFLPVLQLLQAVSRRISCSMLLRKPGLSSRPFFAGVL